MTADGTFTRTALVALVVVTLTMYSATCGGGASSTQPTATPTPTTFSLTGVITDAQTGAGIGGAVAKIGDGPNANKSATADGSGRYSFSGLTQSGFTVNFSAQFYNPTSQGVTLTSNQTVNAALSPVPTFTVSGIGNSVFTLPSIVSTIHVTGTYTASSSNFIVWIGPPGVACDVQINGNCRLIVNALLGTFWGRTVSDGVYQTGGGGVVQIVDSDGVRWSMSEVRNNNAFGASYVNPIFRSPNVDSLQFTSETERRQVLSNIAIQAKMSAMATK